MAAIQFDHGNKYAIMKNKDLSPPIPPRPEAWPSGVDNPAEASHTDFDSPASPSSSTLASSVAPPLPPVPVDSGLLSKNHPLLPPRPQHPALVSTPDSALNSAQDSTQGLTQEPTQNLTLGPTQNLTQGPTQNLTQGPTQNFTQGPTQNLTQGSTQNLTQDPTQNLTQGPTQNLTQGLIQTESQEWNQAPPTSSSPVRRRSRNSLWSAVTSGISEFRQQADSLLGERQQQSKVGGKQRRAAASEPPPLTDVTPVRPTLEQLRDCLVPPVVLVHGLFGFGPDEMLTPKGRLHYWETAIDKETDFHGLLVLEASVGPVSSYHDRACELFAQIIGCQVDYGAGHSRKHRHEQYGRDFTGKPLYPWWSQARPLHFVGHSAGGNTIRQLQQLLQLDYWGRGTNAAWIKSVTCITAPMNGSTAAYLAGCSLETGLFGLSSLVPLVSVVDTLGAVVGFPMAERRRMLLWKLEHFGLQQDDFADFNRLRQRMSDSGFLLGEDNLAYDLTLQACESFNALVLDCPDTYYLSYTAVCSTSTQVKTFMAAPYLYMSNRNFTGPAVPPGWSKRRDWLLSDGLVPLASQVAPSGALPRDTVSLSVPGEPAIRSTAGRPLDLQPGVWYTESIASVAQSATGHWDHCDVICARGLLWEGIVDRIPVISNGAQALFSLGKRLGSVPKERSSFARVSKAEQRRFYEALYARLSGLK